MTNSRNEIIAVIDMGSSAIRLLVAQGHDSSWDLLDSAEQPLALGMDVFRKGVIEKENINRTIGILKGFQELIRPYGVNRILAVGTSALRESINRELFIDRILLQTGIEIRVIDGVEANQLTWLAVRAPLKEAVKGFKKHNALIIEVGAGNTDLMILRKGKVASSHALPIGTLRVLQKLNKRFGDETDIMAAFRNHAVKTVGAVSHEMELSKVSKLVAVGGDARLAASVMGKRISEEIAVIPRGDFASFKDELKTLDPEQIAARLDLPWSDAELLYPALVIFDAFFGTTRADEILVPSASIRHGLLISYAASSDVLKDLFTTQAIAGAWSLAERYRVDMAHAEFVRSQAVMLYDALIPELGLTGHHRHILESAAILHDIGSYIGAASRHKHGQYIIRNSDIFGLSASDKEVVGHIVRYHRRAKPQRNHSLYMGLPRPKRIVVQKLSALLRVADALDRSHSQRVAAGGISITGGKLIIRTGYSGDVSMEELSIADKGDLFEDVFGLTPVLRFDESLMRNENES